MKQNDEPALRASLQDLVGVPAGAEGLAPAVAGLKARNHAAKANKSAATAALRSAQSNGRALTMACVGVLKPRLGNQWNAAWQAAGFTGGTLQVAANPVFVLHNLHDYYSAHPDHEVPNLTAELACTAAAGLARNALDQGIKAARSRLSGLREELARLIGPDDHRWIGFGFDLPSHVGTPETPENLTATAGAASSGMIFVDWDDARRADAYRLRATDAEGKVLAEAQPQDSEATLSGLPVGVTVTLTATARNATGESPASAAISIVIP